MKITFILKNGIVLNGTCESEEDFNIIQEKVKTGDSWLDSNQSIIHSSYIVAAIKMNDVEVIEK